MTRNKNSATELQIALDNRAFEIQLFWQRSNYFLVLMTALGVATFSIQNILLSSLISLLATLASYFWFRTNLGSKFWQENWEAEVIILAEEQDIRSFKRKTNEIIEQVKKSLDYEDKISKKSMIRSYVDKKILEKYSVTYNMILLSMSFTFIWSIITVIFLIRIFVFYKNYLTF